MIYDKTDEFHWSSNVDNWDEFNHNDVVISLDPQERLGEGTVSVCRIDQSDTEKVHHLGLFWSKREAWRFARAFNKKAEESRKRIEEEKHKRLHG